MSDYSEEREALYQLQWDEGEERINNIGVNGNEGEHYRDVLKEYIAAIDKAVPEKKKSKYHRLLPKEGVWIDVYDIIYAWDITNPAIQHAVKKVVQAGERGHKDWLTDIQEAIESLERAKCFPPKEELPF